MSRSGPVNGRYFVGDFDGDGSDDIAYLNANDNRWYIVTENRHPMPGWYPGN